MDSEAVARVHLSACLALVRPVTMTDAAAVEWITVAARELKGFAPSVIEQACSGAKRHCGHHAKILPFVSEECERIDAEFARMRDAAHVIPLLRREPESHKLTYAEILDNEKWLNTIGETQAQMRKMGLKCGALIEDAGAVRYVSELR
jgi:hypothetical protein